jgi:hypothetical protein
MTNEEDEYDFEVIDNITDARTCAQLIAEEFATHNLIAIYDQRTPQSFFDEESWPSMTNLFDQKLSMLARHRGSGEIVAALTAGDLYLTNKKHPYNVSSPPARVPIRDLFDEMNDIFIRHDFCQELRANMVLNIDLGATRAQHSGKGVGYRLTKAVCDHARNTKGFQYAHVQVTHIATRHMYVDKMGGKELTIVDPTTWIWKKKGDSLSCPYKNYQGGCIPNIIVKLTPDEDK